MLRSLNWRAALFVLLCVGTLVLENNSLAAKGTGLVFISNEKSNDITVLNLNGEVLRSFPTCARPRGMHFSHDRMEFYVGCADDSTIAIYETAT